MKTVSSVLRETEEEPPPFLRTWKRIYAAVLGYLAALIALLFSVTWYFAPVLNHPPR